MIFLEHSHSSPCHAFLHYEELNMQLRQGSVYSWCFAWKALTYTRSVVLSICQTCRFLPCHRKIAHSLLSLEHCSPNLFFFNVLLTLLPLLTPPHLELSSINITFGGMFFLLSLQNFGLLLIIPYIFSFIHFSQFIMCNYLLFLFLYI